MNSTSQPRHLNVLHEYFNATALINTSGTVQERYGYDAFGTVRFMNSSFGSVSSSYTWETLYGAYRYAPDTGLYQVRFRYLHPNLGRWLNRDPLGEPAFESVRRLLGMRPAEQTLGSNLLWYVANDPINYVDVLGLEKGASRQLSLIRNRNRNANQNNCLCKLWNLPNTVLGLAWGGLGVAFGADLSIGNNAIQFENHPCMIAGDITIGNTYGDHERQHTYQGEWLGPLYLPANILGGCFSLLTTGTWHERNFMERGPESNPPQPWP